MKSKLAKAVRSRFAAELKTRLPCFQEIPNPWPDCRLYSWQIANDLHLYLYLTFARRDDDFNIEVAWSRKGRYPFDLIPLSSKDKPVDGEMRFSISSLWDPDALEDTCWELRRKPGLMELTKAVAQRQRIPKESDLVALSQVDNQVSDAVNKIVEYAMPYFRKIASDFGVDLPEC